MNIQHFNDKGFIGNFLFIIIITLVIGIGLFIWTKNKNPLYSLSNNKLLSEINLKSSEIREENKLLLELFFSDKYHSCLQIEEREIEVVKNNLQDKIHQVLIELINGPSDNFVETIPSGTKIRSVYVDQGNIVYLDFSQEIVQEHPGGSWAEVVTIYSIVNTITKNFSSIKEVKLLINGTERETLCGHISLRRIFSYLPLTCDY